MDVRGLLKAASREIAGGGSESPELDAELLLADVVGISREKVIVRGKDNVGQRIEKDFWKAVRRRARGWSVAAIVRRKEFYGLEFFVNEDVLVPRPETELIVEEVLKIKGRLPREAVIVDVGTGSGNLAVVLAREFPGTKVFGIDKSARALDVARVNAKRHGVLRRIDFIRGDLLGPLSEGADLVVANLPYLSTDEFRGAPSIQREPKQALVARANGAALNLRMIEQLEGKLKKGGVAFLEINPKQRELLLNKVKEVLPERQASIINDLRGEARILKIG